MLQRIHTFFQNQQAQLRSCQRGQVAIIIVIMLAVGLILYAASVNMGRISSQKVTTMKAAQQSAAQMGSMFASYGESLVQEYLAGGDVYCGNVGGVATGIFIIILIVLIIICVIAPYLGIFVTFFVTCAGTMSPIVVAILIAAMVGLAASLVSLGLQANINSSIVRSWNEMQKGLGDTGMFMERGIQAGLLAAVSDSAMVPDLYDFDQDGKFGDVNWEKPDVATSAPDYISRFAMFNSFREQHLDTGTVDWSVLDFKTALDDLLYAGGGVDWGFYDPVSCGLSSTHPCCSATPLTDPAFPAMCDSCCLPRYVPGSTNKAAVRCTDGTEEIPLTNPNDPDFVPGTLCDTHGGPVLLARECCYLKNGDSQKCGDPMTCWNRSLFSTGGGTNTTLNNYPWVYDAAMPEDSTNNFGGVNPPVVSFHEFLGRDDENPRYKVNSVNPNWQRIVPDDAQVSLAGDPENNQYMIKDTTGFYVPPVFVAPGYTPVTPEEKKGIFSSLYKLQDWGVQLGAMTYDGNGMMPAIIEQGHWCDYTSATSPYSSIANPLSPNYLDPNNQRHQELTDNKLVVPIAPVANAGLGPVYYSGGWCVDNTNLAAGNPPQIPDKIENPDAALFATPGTCPGSQVGWRRGSGRYCSADFPYSAGCTTLNYNTCQETLKSKEGGNITVPRDCMCSDPATAVASAQNEFTDDALDELVYGIPEFYVWAKSILSLPHTMLVSTLWEWYSSAAEWIEPACPPDCNGSVTKKSRAGRLHIWRRIIERQANIRQDWLNQKSVDDDVWCVPDKGSDVDKIVPGYAVAATDTLSEAASFWERDIAGTLIMRNPTGEIVTVGGNPTRGNVPAVISCLRWNAEDMARDSTGAPLNLADGSFAIGNAKKFQGCGEFLAGTVTAIDLCKNRPRSLIPDANFKNKYDLDADIAKDELLLKCEATLPDAGAGTCAADCAAAAAAVPTLTFLPATDCASNPADPSYDPATTAPTNFGEEVRFEEYTLKQAMLTTYAAYLADSDVAAQNQVVKFKKRAEFLQARVNEFEAEQTTFRAAEAELTKFLDGGTPFDEALFQNCKTIPALCGKQDSPVENLIAFVRNWKPEDGLPSVAVYVWKDPPLTKTRFLQDGTPTKDGYTHAVKVEARIPRRCNNACGTDEWPEITGRKQGMWEICYDLKFSPGMVKSRVIRWDEDQQRSAIKFPNGRELWKPKSHHPDAKSTESGNTFDVCRVAYPPQFTITTKTTDPVTGVVTSTSNPVAWASAPGTLFTLPSGATRTNNNDKFYGDAFMLNRPPYWAAIVQVESKRDRTQESRDAVQILLNDLLALAPLSPEQQIQADDYQNQINLMDDTIAKLTARINDEAQFAACWQKVHDDMLSNGVVSESCAQYYYYKSTGVGYPSGFKVKYVPCDKGFLQGTN